MKRRIFGQLDGAPVEAVTLDSPDAAVTILSFGCVLQDWRIGGMPVVLGFADLDSTSPPRARMARSSDGWRTGRRAPPSRWMAGPMR